MSYDKCTSLSVNVKKEEINVTSYASNVYPAIPEKWQVGGNDFRDKIRNLLRMNFDGTLKLLPSNNSNTAFALRLTRDYFEVLTGEKLDFDGTSFYNMVKDYDSSLNSVTLDICFLKELSVKFRGLYTDDREKLLKSLNSYQDFKEDFKYFYDFYNKIIEKMIDFFLKVISKDYPQEFKEKNFLTYLIIDNTTYTGVKIKETKYGHKFERDYKYKDFKGAYYPSYNAYSFSTKIYSKKRGIDGKDHEDIIDNLKIVEKISGISEAEKICLQTSYKKYIGFLDERIKEMAIEVSDKVEMEKKLA